LKVAKHGPGRRVFVIEFRYLNSSGKRLKRHSLGRTRIREVPSP
jgi:hypothetical protein